MMTHNSHKLSNLPLILSMVISLFWLIGCNTAAPLPTLAVAAIAPEGSSEGTPLPATWTPAAAGVPLDRQSNFNLQGTLGPTLMPSATGFLPSSTPRPSRTPTPSPTVPTPTPTDTPPQADPLFPYPPIRRFGSKLGIHIIRNNDTDIMEFIRSAQPAVIKALDDFGYLQEVKRVSPQTIIIGRIDDIHSQNYQGVPEEAARQYVSSQLEKYFANPAVDYWEGWNEPDPDLDKMGWYTRFEQERIRLLASYGLRAAIGGFATGVPEMAEFQLFIPAIETAKQYGAILTLHEYSAPDMTYLYGGSLPGYPSYPDRGSLTFRYRWYYREFLEPAGLVIPLVITEAGVDGIIGNRPGPQGLGWQDFQGYWVQQGWGNNGPEAFINQLAWYDQGVRQDDYVIGFTIFTAGGYGYWENYNINSILPNLRDYVRSQ